MCNGYDVYSSAMQVKNVLKRITYAFWFILVGFPIQKGIIQSRATGSKQCQVQLFHSSSRLNAAYPEQQSKKRRTLMDNSKGTRRLAVLLSAKHRHQEST